MNNREKYERDRNIERLIQEARVGIIVGADIKDIHSQLKRAYKAPSRIVQRHRGGETPGRMGAK